MLRVVLGFALIVFLFVGSYGFAQEHHHGHATSEEAKPIAEIMQGMNSSLHDLTSAIVLEDYALIAAAAQGIVNHPGIAQEDLDALFARLGTEKEAFIACDGRVHELAGEIAEAGEQENMDIALEKYSAMIGKTVECHRNYRSNMKVGSEK